MIEKYRVRPKFDVLFYLEKCKKRENATVSPQLTEFLKTPAKCYSFWYLLNFFFLFFPPFLSVVKHTHLEIKNLECCFSSSLVVDKLSLWNPHSCCSSTIHMLAADIMLDFIIISWMFITVCGSQCDNNYLLIGIECFFLYF